MREEQFKNKMSCFTFALSVLVIWSHSYNLDLLFENGLKETVWERLEKVMSIEVAQVAVPAFFMTSGYLFYRHFDLDKLWEKWKKRIKSLFIPYIIWNVVYYMGYIGITFIPVLKRVSGKERPTVSVIYLFYAALTHAYNGTFWYLQQLIILIIIAPLIYRIAKQKGIAMILLVILISAICRKIEIRYLNLDALFYYLLAAHGALCYADTIEANWNRKRCLLACLGVLLSGYFYSQQYHSIAYLILFRALMAICLWIMVPYGKAGSSKPWMKISFFTYAAHFALVRTLNKTVAYVWQPCPEIMFLLFLMMPFLAIATLYWIATRIKREYPVVWGTLTGFRG